ncbi:MAG TPA: hypothetical protein VIR58_02730 [Acidimicrobiales bacterium]
MSGRPDRESGTGLISSAAGVVVFLMFLMLAVQLLFGLYATSTVNAIANDAVQRAAGAGAPSLEEIEADARNSLGRIGQAAEFDWTSEDTDGDGIDDTVVLDLVVRPPRFVPASLGGAIGLDDVHRRVSIRREEFDG